ncbi:methionine aminotransferase [uncultured Roseivirga sp.]|uniref:methionine aminotransferase n=1 Tax=uncultured Roseivirga sp. TaxID=543088 RepID=UPI000D7B7772|nr:methionine aminotransferase [uncultured Roseivirga sp.]PWL24831.1 MAG: aminotransferase [Roseivirga sp. XM-24bin3]
MQIESKLPNVGITIFTKMSKMAQEYGAINLSQGFPDFDVAPELIEKVCHYMKQGKNQYPPMAGVLNLREAIAEKIERSHDWLPKVENVLVTCGAIEAIFNTISAFVHSGDEVIIMNPAYDAYEAIIDLQGAKAVGVNLQPKDYSIDWHSVKQAISDKTRMIIINSPHNPSGATISKDDLKELERLTKDTEILVLSDEVYEHIVFDGKEHNSILTSEELRKRAVATFSFGKTFHATGWRMGYLVAPDFLMKEILKIHQYNTFTIHAPSQYAIADYLKTPENYESIAAMYQEKRDFFLKAMEGSRFKPVKSSGTYFQLMDYSAITDKPDVEMAEWLTKEIGVAAIPTSVFYQNGQDNKALRFCFAKNEETLKAAADKLKDL